MGTALAIADARAEQHARWLPAHKRLWGGKAVAEHIVRPRVDRPRPKLVVLPVLNDRYGWPLYLAPAFYDHCDGSPLPAPRKTMKQIAREVAAKHGISMVDLKSARRDRPTVLARQEAIYRMRTETLRSLPEIGRFFNRDHTTALHAVRVHSKRLETANKAEANR